MSNDSWGNFNHTPQKQAEFNKNIVKRLEELEDKFELHSHNVSGHTDFPIRENK